MADSRTRRSTQRDATEATPPVVGVPRTVNQPESTIHNREDGAPASIAVALAQDPQRPDVQRVAAAGKGWVAEQIIALAFEHGIKVRQDADLVQILSALDADAGIPLEAYTAVSEILAHVYRANLSAMTGPETTSGDADR